jgi:hypothetical protein
MSVAHLAPSSTAPAGTTCPLCRHPYACCWHGAWGMGSQRPSRSGHVACCHGWVIGHCCDVTTSGQLQQRPIDKTCHFMIPMKPLHRPFVWHGHWCCCSIGAAVSLNMGVQQDFGIPVARLQLWHSYWRLQVCFRSTYALQASMCIGLLTSSARKTTIPKREKYHMMIAFVHPSLLP